MLSIDKLTLSIVAVKLNAFEQIPVQVKDVHTADSLSTSWPSAARCHFLTALKTQRQ